MAALCPNGTVNWKQIYGEEAFLLRQPIYESSLREKRRAKQFNLEDIEKKAREFAQVRGRGLLAPACVPRMRVCMYVMSCPLFLYFYVMPLGAL